MKKKITLPILAASIACGIGFGWSHNPTTDSARISFSSFQNTTTPQDVGFGW